MDMKLNHSDFSALFAKSHGISQADAEAFTKTFFDTIVEGLENEGSVKINGLGTFKIVEVESRSSVNVNTGERFEIKGHKKMTFLPADSLKDTINAPFAMFEPVEVDDELVDDEDDTANVTDEDAVDVVEDVQPAEVVPEVVPVSEIEEEMPAEAETVVAPVVAEYEEEMPMEPEESLPATVKVKSVPATESIASEVAVDEQPVDAADVAEPVADDVLPTEAHAATAEPVEVAAEAEKPSEPIDESDSKPRARSNGYDYNTTASKERRSSNVRPLLVALLVLLLVGGGFAGYYFFANEPESANKTIIADKRETATKVQQVSPDTLKPAAVVAEKDTLSAVEVPTENESIMQQTEYKFVVTAALEGRNLANISVADTVDYKMAGYVCEHKVEIDETLIKISLKHYGDKRLWPYIVAYNNMSRPNDLACGMLLKIPKLIPMK